MSNTEFDSLVQRVLIESIKIYIEPFENDQLLFSPSADYNRQIISMLSNPLRWAKRRLYSIRRRLLNAVAMIAITIMIAFGCVVASSIPVRAAVIKFVQEIYENYLIYHFAGKDRNSRMTNYEITELPDGYEEYERNIYSGLVDVIYKNNDGEYIYFRYIYMKESTASSFYIDESSIKFISDVNVNNMDGKYFESNYSDGMNTLMWINQDANLQFILEAQMPYLDILHIGESVSLCKDTKN